MAASSDSGDSVGSWPGFVAQLNSTFNLLRDVFGYAMPGGVFIATGLLSKRFSLADVDNLLRPYHPPTWAFVILVVGACYIIGNTLAATAYLPIALAKWAIWEGSRIRRGILKPLVRRLSDGQMRRGLKRVDGMLVAWLKPWLEENPTEVSAVLLEVRSRNEKLMAALDRRETLTILGGSTAVALLGGWAIFFKKPWPVSTILCWAGGLVLLQFFTGVTHLRRVAGAIVKADAELRAEEKAKVTPDFNQPIADMVKAVESFVAAVKATAKPPVK
jgi:hypothetical protein